MSIREEFYKEFKDVLHDTDPQTVADWWITTLKERIEATDRIVLTEGSEEDYIDSNFSIGWNARGETITRLLE